MSARILERPWAADPYLHMIMQKYIQGTSAMAQKIEHSPMFKQWFKGCQAHATIKIHAEVASLRSAKHRFESHIKPLARMVLYIEAVLYVALRIVAVRTDQAAEDAKAFLTGFCDEHYIQMALMADAGDEVSMVIRTTDEESWDVAVMNDTLVNFKERVTRYFVRFEIAPCGQH